MVSRFQSLRYLWQYRTLKVSVKETQCDIEPNLLRLLREWFLNRKLGIFNTVDVTKLHLSLHLIVLIHSTNYTTIKNTVLSDVLTSSSLKTTTLLPNKANGKVDERTFNYLLRRASAIGSGFFCPSGKKGAYFAVWLILGHFWCPVVTLVTGWPSVPNLGTDGQVWPSVPILGMDGKILEIHFLNFF